MRDKAARFPLTLTLTLTLSPTEREQWSALAQNMFH